MQIAAAIPPGSRRPRTQRQFLRAVLRDEQIAGLRADRRQVVYELARILARHASWATMTSWRPRARACAEIGSPRDPGRPLSISAYKAARRVLEERGFLGLVSPGWTPALRAMPLAGEGDHGLCAVFVLAVPRRKHWPARRRLNYTRVIRPLTRSAKAQDPPRARGARGRNPGAARVRTRGLIPGPALAALRQGPGKTLSERYLSWIARPYVQADYSPADLAYAIDHDPSGTQHRHTDTVRHPAGWLRWRLGRWLAPDGTPLPSRSRQLAAARAQLRTVQAAARAQRQAAAAAAADPAPYAAAIRARFGWRPRDG